MGNNLGAHLSPRWDLQRGLNSLKVPVYFSPDRKAACRQSNLMAILSRGSFPGLQYSIADIIDGHVPDIIGPVRNVIAIIEVYDSVIDDVVRNSQRYFDAVQLADVVIRINPFRHEYRFVDEAGILSRCEWLLQNSRASDEWGAAMNVYRQSFDGRFQVAVVLCIIGQVVSLAPGVLPYCELSSVIAAILANDYQTFFHALEKFVINAAQEVTRALRAPEVPAELKKLLELLTDGQAQSRQELMDAIGITSRAKFSDTCLNPALEASLVERTEKDPNSSKQRYRLTEVGRQRLRKAKCIGLKPFSDASP